MTRMRILVLVVLALVAPVIAVALAGAKASSRALSTSDVATHLAENGFRVLKLEREANDFTAELVDRQSGLVTARIDPHTAELLTTRSVGRAGPLPDQWLTLTQVARRLEGQGFQVVRIESTADGYVASLADRSGVRSQAALDPRTGEIHTAAPR